MQMTLLPCSVVDADDAAILSVVNADDAAVLSTLTRLLVELILLLLLVVSAVCAATVSCFSGLRRHLSVVSAVCAATGCHQPHCWQP